MIELGSSFLLLVLLASPSRADLIAVSNLGEPLSGGFGLGTLALAGSFTTADGAYTLNSVVVSAFSNSAGSATLRLRTDVLGMPGVLVEDLGSNRIGAGSSAVTYAYLGTALQPNTTYWVTLGEAGSGDFQWNVTTSTAETSSVAWTIGDQARFSNDGGTIWQQVFFGPPNESPRFAINARPAVVPEPSTLSVIGLGLAGLLGVHRRRRNRTA